MAATATSRQAIRKALAAYRAVRHYPVIGGSLAYFKAKEAARAAVLEAVAAARGYSGGWRQVEAA